MELQALREKLRDYEHVIETMHCGLVAEDHRGTLIFANQRLLDWLGYERDEVVGKHIHGLAPGELEPFLDEDLRRAEEGDLRARLMVLRRKDGTTLPVITLPQRFFDVEGNPDGFFAVVVDLGAVLTARQVGPGGDADARAALQRIALELQSISLTASLGGSSPLPAHHPALKELSPREIEVLTLLASGDRVQGIAARLYISEHTVRNHLKSIYRKVGVSGQAELVERMRELAREGQAPA